MVEGVCYHARQPKPVIGRLAQEPEEVLRPVSTLDVQWWSLVVGLGVFGAIILATFARRRLKERREDTASSAGHGVDARAGTPATPGGRAVPGETSSGRRRRSSPPPPGEPREIVSAIRSSILRAVAERMPTGWSALILSPPPHPERMTWHIHLAPDVALDLRDGRTVSVAAPAASHDWQIPGGRTVGIGDGDPEPPPGDEAVAVRVTGPYCIVAVSLDVGQSPLLVARVIVAEDDALPQPRATATDARAVQGALREAIELTVGSRMTGSPPAVGYPLTSWSGHERIWLTIGR